MLFATGLTLHTIPRVWQDFQPGAIDPPSAGFTQAIRPIFKLGQRPFNFFQRREDIPAEGNVYRLIESFRGIIGHMVAVPYTFIFHTRIQTDQLILQLSLFFQQTLPDFFV